MLTKKITNADIVTMDPARPSARELGIWHGLIVGLDEEVAGLPALEVVDLDGAAVLPGFIDAHVHLVWAGLAARTMSVAPSDSVTSILTTVAEAVADTPLGGWVELSGYDQRPLGRHLAAVELDTVSAGRKVLVTHASGHGCVVNTAVLDQLPLGSARMGGFLAEEEMAAARRLRPPRPLTELVDAIAHSSRVCRQEGITGCAEAGLGSSMFAYGSLDGAAFQLALDQGRLAARTQLMVAADALRPIAAADDDLTTHAMSLGLRTGFGDGPLSLGALKVFTDGGMMARTAALTAPYEGTTNTGQLQATDRPLTDIIVDGHLAGWQLAVHAIGDRAVDVALDALAQAQRSRPRPDARHRIEHAGLVRPDQLRRFASLGVTAVVQPAFLRHFGDDYAAIMGSERAPWLYRGRGFIDSGVRLVGSSDRPVADGSPLRAMQFMIERTSLSGQVIGPDEGITVEEALRAYTVDAAHACHWEDSAGSISPGKRADLVVLDANPKRVQPSGLGDIRVLGTFLAGESDL
ncbi:amidohydrolase [Streptomyces sp. NPDC005953]|uniref:amidohydrolase n=1 Tax=Streptomyces sp. NPDC005953 TaxID=3156719 RepID=UPI0033D7CC16